MSNSPAARASSRPASVKSTSVQPVNRFARFHSLSPWRRRTSLCMRRWEKVERRHSIIRAPTIRILAVQFFTENIFLFAIAFASGGMLLWPIVRARAAGPTVTTLEATRLINSKNAQIVDVRAASDFAAGTLPSARSEEHTSELQSHSDLHSFPTRRSSDLDGHHARSNAPHQQQECTDRGCSRRFRFCGRHVAECKEHSERQSQGSSGGTEEGTPGDPGLQ